MPFLADDIRDKFHKFTASEDCSADWEPLISIGTAAGHVGLSVSALRKYETEGLLLFHRTASGHRLLSRADIERIRVIQRLINELGLNMEGIRRLLALLPCWQLRPCTDEEKNNCEAARDTVHPCWMVRRSECKRLGVDCRTCRVYRYGAYCTEFMKSLLFNVESQAGGETTAS
ncbi:MAG TPA: MerR family transcriptional regulator [Candidatus Deferrimicrobium sp.]|nr:MerR family transcriptional regulator [Candidatus Deferrimicrobium sp.]